jgi:hypothetical protein
MGAAGSEIFYSPDEFYRAFSHLPCGDTAEISRAASVPRRGKLELSHPHTKCGHLLARLHRMHADASRDKNAAGNVITFAP